MDLKNLEEGYETLKQAFPEFRLSKIHGRMKSAEKEAEMEQFVKGETQIPRCHHRDRGRRECAQCLGDGNPGCPALRTLAAAPAQRTSGTWLRPELLHPGNRLQAFRRNPQANRHHV